MVFAFVSQLWSRWFEARLVEENERQITVATGTGSQLRFGTSIVEILLSKAAQYELDKVDSNDI